MQKVFRLVRPFTGHLRQNFIHRTYSSEPKTKLADRAKEITLSHNRIETIKELQPIIDQILSNPTSGRKRNNVSIHPTAKQDKYDCPDVDKPHTFFMDLIEDHIKYFESEGFVVSPAINPADEDLVKPKTTNHKYPHHIVVWKI